MSDVWREREREREREMRESGAQRELGRERERERERKREREITQIFYCIGLRPITRLGVDISYHKQQ